MLTRRLGALWARVLLGTALGAVLVCGGVGLSRRTAGVRGSSEWFEESLGVTGVLAGLVWFMIVVADRVCPLERRGWVDLIEGVLMAGVIVGLGWSARMYLLGANG